MSTKLVSGHSSESSPATSRSHSSFYPSSPQIFPPSQNAPSSLSRRNSAKATPTLIITETSSLPGHAGTTNDSTSQNRHNKANSVSLAVGSPSLFNFKKSASNNYTLPPTVVSKSADKLSTKFLTDNNTIVIDVRPYTSYLHSRLLNALNICVPTTLLKRKAFALKNIIGSMQKFQQDYINLKLESSDRSDFVIYDENSCCSNCSLHLYQTCLKIQDYASSVDKECTISILANGITSIDASSPLLDHSEVPVLSPISPTFSELSQNTASPISNKMTGSGSESPASSNYCLASFSSFALPSANDFSSTFAASIKKNKESVAAESATQSENDVIHLPKHCKLNEENVPRWLHPFLNSATGFKQIAKRFNKIEDIENRRLENVARLNVPGEDNNHGCGCSSGMCSPSAPCPGCDQISYTLPEGIEFGDKNRYSSIWPYEHSRVKILHSPAIATSSKDSFPTSEKSDYFNANYVTVPRISSNRYIATQAPLPSTFDDFWRAVWYNNVEVIVCLTNLNEGGFKKSDNYWQSSVYSSGLAVELLSEVADKELHIVARTLKLQKYSSQANTKETKIVRQIEFLDWPDFGVPPSSEAIIKLINLKNSFVHNKKAPLVVHCSAGCGRTGTFITIDVLLQLFRSSQESPTLALPLTRQSSLRSPFAQLDHQLLFKNKIDDKDATSTKKFQFWGDDDLVYKTVNMLRRQRLSMVQTLNQYVMCYETLLMAINESQPSDN